MPGIVHFLVHVPKCAGTTAERHFAHTLGEGFLRAPRWENPLRDVIGNRVRLDPGRAARIRVASGHSLSVSLRRALPPGTDVRESVLLREPVGWFLSFYNYRIARHRERGERHPGSFAEWYRTQRKNPVARFLLTRYLELGYPGILALSSRAQLARLNRELARFRHVGDIAGTDAFLARLSDELGVPRPGRAENVGTVREATRATIGEAMAARLLAENAVDAALHALWKDRGEAPGLPPGTAAAEAALPADDHLAYLAADLRGGILKKLARRPG